MPFPMLLCEITSPVTRCLIGVNIYKQVWLLRLKCNYSIHAGALQLGAKSLPVIYYEYNRSCVCGGGAEIAYEPAEVRMQARVTWSDSCYYCFQLFLVKTAVFLQYKHAHVLYRHFGCIQEALIGPQTHFSQKVLCRCGTSTAPCPLCAGPAYVY